MLQSSRGAMPSYRLIYFNNRGRAEVTRLLFTVAGQQFDDVRISYKDWPAEKYKFPLRQLPILEIDGKMIPQSQAMAGYVAREFGLYGSNSLETMMVDVICGIADDLFTPLGKALFVEKDEARKAEAIKNYYDNTVPILLEGLERFLVENKGGDGFFVGEKISLADISAFVSLDLCLGKREEILANYPKLVDLRDRIASEPKIATYLAQRPQTMF